MNEMFSDCSSLKKINFSPSTFDKNNDIIMIYMFSGCSDELKKKIRAQIKNLKEEAFY